MKIACITSSYPKTDADHAGRFVKEWVDTVRAQHEVDVFCWTDRGENIPGTRSVRYAPKQFERIFFRDGAPENLKGERALNLLLPGLFAGMIRSVIAKGPYDLIVGHWAAPSGLAARVAAKMLGINALVICHSGGVHALRSKPLLRAIAGNGPTTVCSTAQLSVFPNARVLPMGFQPLPQSDPRSRKVLVMSRLVPIKNVERILRDFKNQNTEIHVAGDGPERTRLEKIAPPNTTFHGYVTGAEKVRLFQECGYFLLASKTLDGRHEGLPVSLMEAMGSGLTPLVANFPGLSDLLPASQILSGGDSFYEKYRESERKSFVKNAERLTWERLAEEWLAVVAWAARF